MTINPAGLTFVTRSELSGSELAAFRGRLAELQRVRPGAALAQASALSGAHGATREIDRLDGKQAVG